MATVVSRVDPPIPLSTPNGPGLAHWRIEYGIEMPTHYEVHLHSGQIWQFSQTVLRCEPNVSAGRTCQTV